MGEQFLYLGKKCGEIVVWDLKKKEAIKVLNNHKKQISELSFNSHIMASGTNWDGYISFWNVDKNRLVGRMQVPGQIINIIFK